MRLWAGNMARQTKKQNLSKLALNLRLFRDRLGWTQSALSERADISQSSIASLEIDRWKNPRLYPLMNIADAFGISLDELLGRLLPGSSTEKLLTEYMQSAWHKSVPATAEDLDWIRRLPPATWAGKRPTARDVARLIEWRRDMEAIE